MADKWTLAVMGVVPPEVAEARIAERWPSVAAYPGMARLGSTLQQAGTSAIRGALKQQAFVAGVLLFVVVPLATMLAFIAWLMLAPFYFVKTLPFFSSRYALTNRRLMIQKGLRPVPIQEVKLEEIDEVRVVPGSEQPFYRAADLEILSNGKASLKLRGVKEYQQFLINIQDAYVAWGRKSPPSEQTHPASALK